MIKHLHFSILITKSFNEFNQWWKLIQMHEVGICFFSLSVNMHCFSSLHSLSSSSSCLSPSLPPSLCLWAVLSGGRSDVRAPPPCNAWIIAGVKWIWTCSQPERVRGSDQHTSARPAVRSAVREPRWVQGPPGSSAGEVRISQQLDRTDLDSRL